MGEAAKAVEEQALAKEEEHAQLQNELKVWKRSQRIGIFQSVGLAMLLFQQWYNFQQNTEFQQWVQKSEADFEKCINETTSCSEEKQNLANDLQTSDISLTSCIGKIQNLTNDVSECKEASTWSRLLR